MAQITLTPIIEGTLARASEVMGNFQAIADVVNGGLDGSNIQDGSITSPKIVNGAVTNSKLATNSVDSPQLVNGSVTNDKLGPLSVTGPKIADGAVSTSKIGDLQVTTPKLGNLAVTNAKLGNSAVTRSKLGLSAVGPDNIESYAVTNHKLGDNAVNSRVLATDAVLAEHIKNGEVTTDKIDNGAVTNVKIASGISTSKLVGALPPSLISNGTITPAKTNFMNSNGSNASIYVVRMSADGSSSGSRLPSGWSVTRTSVGTYRITHNLGTTDYVVVVSVAGGLNARVMVSSKSNTQFWASVVRHDGVQDDTALDFVVIRY